METMITNALYRQPWFTPCALALLTLLAYANSFPGAFILDDLHIVRNNGLVNNPDLYTIFTSDYWHGIENSGLFRPLTILSLAINRLLLGEAPLGFHLVNILLHAGVAVLLWRTLLVWGLPGAAALMSALLFALHPIHTQVINEVVGRSELLVALFLLAGFIMARRRGVAAGLVVCLCYLLALLSKEHAITFLALLPLWDAFDAGTFRVWRQRWPLYAGLLAVAILWLLWREYGVVNLLPRTRVTEAAAPLAHVDGITRVLTALLLQGIYLVKLLVPVGLQSVYSVADLPEFIRTFLSLRAVLVGAGTLLVVLLLLWGWRRRSPMALFGVLYLVAFSPTANIFIPIGVAMAERLAYFPSIWFCAALGVGGAALLEHPRWRQAVFTMTVVYAVGLCCATLQRNPAFASEVQLWQAEVEQNPKDYLGWQSLAESYSNQIRLDEADAAYRRMLELAPDYPGGLRSRTYFLLRAGRYPEALQTAARVYALSTAADDVVALAFDGLDMAEVHLGLQEFTTALADLENPATQPLREHLRFRELRGKALAGLGRDEEAVQEFARIDVNFAGSDIRFQQGQSLYRLGRLSDARKELEVAVQIRGDGPAWNLLGVVCAQMGDLPAAVTAFEKATAVEPESVYYRENLQRAQREK